MKKLFNSISATLPHFGRRNSALAQHNLTHPQRDWGGAVAVFFLTVILAGLWAFLLYQEVTTIERLDETQVTSETLVFRPEQVTAALEALEARAARYDAARASIIGTGSGGDFSVVTATTSIDRREEPQPLDTPSLPIPTSTPTAETETNEEPVDEAVSSDEPLLPVVVPDGSSSSLAI
jgi:hypothetical protein